MALMPEDLQNKRFTPVRFSEGYDMDEVDNYLDNDVMPRLQQLIDENDRLKRELDEANNRIAELEGSAQHGASAEHGASAVPAVGHDDAAEEHDADVAPQETASASAATAHAVDAPAAGTAHESTIGAPDASAAGIIALAHRLHDEHVKHGEDERDRLIAEANDEHRRIIGEAEEKSRTTLEALEKQKGELEREIDSLRTFERDYRNRLRNYLENQLRELDTNETQDKKANYGL